MLVLGHLFLGQKLGMHDIYWYQINYKPVLEMYLYVFNSVFRTVFRY